MDDVKLRRSDTVEVSGDFKSGFGSFSGSIFRASLLKVERQLHGDIFIEV